MLNKFLFGGLLASSVYIQNSKKPECCGIFGVVSNSPKVQKKNKYKTQQKDSSISVEALLTNGVQLLKNRGYDSAGIVSFAKNQNNIQRMLGKFAQEGDTNSRLNCIQRLVQKFTKQTINSTIGIAHTRWATCGQVNQRNCHPHYDQNQSIFLVHNGIINNHSQIKSKYLSDINFRSQTDTQVIAQLIGKIRKQNNILDALKSLQKYLNKDSKWGIVLIDNDNLNTIYTSTKEQPILVGFSENQNQIFVASEKIAFQQHADCFFETKDHEVWQLSVDRITSLKKQLEEQGRLILIDNSTEVLKEPPKPYERFFDYQIRMQGQLQFKPDFQKLNQINFGDYLSMIACGSSYFAAMSAVWHFKHLKCFRKVNVYDPVQLQPEDITENQAVVMISQSGQTKDLINIVQQCKKKVNVKTVGIINVQGSTLARKTDYPIYIKVGRQVSVAATKSFFHQVLNLIYYATLVAEKKKSADMKIIQQIRQNLIACPQVAKKCINMVQKSCEQLAKIIYNKQSLYLLALRESLAIARQAALKLKQLNYIHAEAMGACQMKHGPIALIASDKPQQTVVFLFILDNETFPLLMNTLDQMHSRKAYVIVITDCKKRMQQSFEEQAKKSNKNIKDIVKKYHFIIQIPHLPMVSHLISVIPMQLLVEKIAKIKKINPDMPRNLAKTVTV